MITALELVLLVLIGISVLFYLGCAVCTIRFFSANQQETGTVYQPVSVLIPVCGVEEGAWENWSSFCLQDCEHYEVLFGVMNPQDPAVPVLQELVAKFPQKARLILCQEVRGINYQVSNLMHLVEAAQHEVVIFTDSDMRVSPDYVRTVTAPLVDQAIGVVTCGYVTHDPQFLGSALASMGRCFDFIPSVLVARSLDGGMQFALGATIATRKSVVAKFGGLQNVVNRIGSDYHIGRMAVGAGYRVELSEYIVENASACETFGQVFRREWRWARTIRLNRGFQYYGVGLGYGTVYCVPLLLLSGFQNWAVTVAVATIAFRVVQTLTAIYSMKCPNLLWWLWALPLRDLMSFFIWVAGGFGQKIYWRGRWLQVEAGGTLQEVVSR
jgi:ceramide glucosyltransferase